jgi:hypothetical protein
MRQEINVEFLTVIYIYNFVNRINWFVAVMGTISNFSGIGTEFLNTIYSNVRSQTSHCWPSFGVMTFPVVTILRTSVKLSDCRGNILTYTDEIRLSMLKEKTEYLLREEK